MERVDINLKPDELIDLLRRRREQEIEDDQRRENRDRMEEEVMLEELKGLQDEQIQIMGNISKNLKTIVACKHGLLKIIQSSDTSETELPKLPVTHKHQEDAINFVSRAINVVNNFSEIQESVAPENNVDTIKLTNEINKCGESVNQVLNRSKIRLDQVEVLMEDH